MKSLLVLLLAVGAAFAVCDQVLGFEIEMSAIVAGVVLLVGVLILFKLRRRVSADDDGDGDGEDDEYEDDGDGDGESDEGVLPPSVEPFKLVAKRRRHARNKAKTTSLAGTLAKKGFISVGFFQVDGEDVFLEGMINSDMDAYAVVYDGGDDSFWVDVITPYENGGSYTCTTMDPDLATGPRAPDMELVDLPNRRVGQLLAHMTANRPKDETEAVSKKLFKKFYEEYQNRHRQWLIEFGEDLERIDREILDEFLHESGMSWDEYKEVEGDYFIVHSKVAPAAVAAKLSLGKIERNADPIRLVEDALKSGGAFFSVAAKFSSPVESFVLHVPEEAEVDVIEVDSRSRFAGSVE